MLDWTGYVQEMYDAFQSYQNKWFICLFHLIIVWVVALVFFCSIIIIFCIICQKKYMRLQFIHIALSESFLSTFNNNTNRWLTLM